MDYKEPRINEVFRAFGMDLKCVRYDGELADICTNCDLREYNCKDYTCFRRKDKGMAVYKKLKQFKVRIIEQLERSVEVTAATGSDAIAAVSCEYFNGEIVLGADDIAGDVEFHLGEEK